MTQPRNVTIGEVEAPFTGPFAPQLESFASAWWDMKTCAQALYERSQLPDDMTQMFTRRAIFDGAVVAYARCFNRGKRRMNLNWITKDFTEGEDAVHVAAMRWRNKNAAHRDDDELEETLTTVVFGNFGASEAGLRVRLQQVRPDEVWAQALMTQAERIAARIWEEKLTQLKGKILTPDVVEQARPVASTGSYRPRFTTDPGETTGVQLNI